MPVRQALNTVYARVVSGMDGKDRARFDSDLYGWTAENKAGNDVLRDIRDIDDARTGGTGGGNG